MGDIQAGSTSQPLEGAQEMASPADTSHEKETPSSLEESASTQGIAIPNQGNTPRAALPRSPRTARSASGPFQFRFQPPTPQQFQARGGQGRPPLPQDTGHTGQDHRGPSYEMSGLSNALPDFQSPTAGHGHANLIHQQRFPSAASTPALVYQLQQISQFAGRGAISPPNSAVYNVPYPQQYSTVYQPSNQSMRTAPQMFSRMAPAQPMPTAGSTVVQPGYPQAQWIPAQPQQPYYYYSAPYNPGGPSQQSFQPSPYPVQGLRRTSLPVGHDAFRPMDGNLSPNNASFPPQSTLFAGGAAFNYGSGGPSLRPGSVPAVGSRGSSGSNAAQPTLPRGPPRKPKQSGHALWVGNLPPGANVVDLKDHFSREATKDIESVFLIPKSNCAFVNYRTEEACSAAMTRFHDSRFHGVRLVCRLRRGSSASLSGAPTGPSVSLSPNLSELDTTPSPVSVEEVEEEDRETEKVSREEEQDDASEPIENAANAASETDAAGGSVKVKERFFIVKSLTVEDLEISVRNGIWATQAHNEATLNRAYETAENVYLIFSANKSGEYFGYARMASPIDDESTAAIQWAPASAAIEDPDLPKAIPTPATEFAPKGHIIDDLARGTIFWEADSDVVDEKGSAEDAQEADNNEDATAEQGEGSALVPTAQVWGKAFRVEWLSTNRLPFYRTRGLRNPLNQHREVKIARDGTELEASVGRRLLQMFNRSGPGNNIHAAPAGLSGIPSGLPTANVPLAYPGGRSF